MSSSAAIPAMPDAALIEKLVMANRILFYQGVVDGFGRISVRHDKSPDHFFTVSQPCSGARKSRKHSSSGHEWQPGRAFRAPLMFGAVHSQRNLQSPPRRDVRGA